MNTHADAPIPAAHLLLGAYLRTLGVARGVNPGDLTASSDQDTRWITEPGAHPLPQPDQLATLLALLGVTDPALVRSAQVLLAPSAHPHRLIDTAPGWSQRFAACERAATTLRLRAPLNVPAVLQTTAYARALRTPSHPRADELCPPGSRLLPTDHIQHVTVVLDEMVLLPGIGSAAVMAEQIAFLQQRAESDGLDLRVLPQHAGFLPRALCEMTFAHRGRRLYADEEGQHPMYVSGPASVCGSLQQILSHAIHDAAPAEASRALLQRHRQHHEEQRLRQMLPKPPQSGS
ncbi:Scr1 family TA system antitoxin-like transcriptional regulator [Streptomyces rimosus]|uniref:Scr1 family TA system antitoxin-like transcriptional regulator n=1 Tax=Streptomyces rimosus TaxID=1927 RepID=UPI0031D0EE4A